MSLRPHYFLFPVSCHYLSSFDLCLLSGLGGLLSSCWITDLTFQRFKNFLPAKEYVKAVYCHPAYLTYMQSTCMHAKSLRSCPTLCDPVDCSLPGSSVHGFSSGKNTGGDALPSSRGSSLSRDQTHISYILPALAGMFCTTSATWEALYAEYIM